MKNIKSIGILIFLSIALCAMSQNPTINQLNRTQKAFQRFAQMLGVDLDSKIVDSEPISDIDGNVYRTVKIGDKIWMAENLVTTHYRNGDSIACVMDSASWVGLTTGAWCTSNGARYSLRSQNDEVENRKLYNYFAVSDKRGLAPKGWHVATNSEWKQLRDVLFKTVIVGETIISNDGDKLNLSIGGGMRNKEQFYNNKVNDSNSNNNEDTKDDKFISWYWTKDDSCKDSWTWFLIYFISGTTIQPVQVSDVLHYTGLSVRCVKDVEVVKPATVKPARPATVKPVTVKHNNKKRSK